MISSLLGFSVLSKCPQASLDTADSSPGFRSPLIADKGLHYPFYSKKCLRTFQPPENGEVRDQYFEEEVLKTYKIKDRDPACSLHITGEKHATLKKF